MRLIDNLEHINMLNRYLKKKKLEYILNFKAITYNTITGNYFIKKYDFSFTFSSM